MKYWIDGKVMADFPGLTLRSVDSLKLDVAKIGLHAQHSDRVNKKLYDNLVIAKKYIGPMPRLDINISCFKYRGTMLKFDESAA